MGWKDLLATGEETVILPWTGGRRLHSRTRQFKVGARLREFGWYRFRVDGNSVVDPEPVDPEVDRLQGIVVGYLVGDRIVPDDTFVDPDPSKIVDHSEKVFVIPEGLDRFVRVRAGRVYPEGPLVFMDEAFPLGPEGDVLDAFLEEAESVREIGGVTPGLDAAFRMETYQREEAERRRRELERLRAEEEARRELERRREELRERLGDGEGRRAMARENFREAARAALTVGGAKYLDHRQVRKGEMAVKYRVDGQRLECICDLDLRIIDAGVCLVNHDTGEKGDTYFTLESLPGVIRQAIREHKLVIWRHA